MTIARYYLTRKLTVRTPITGTRDFEISYKPRIEDLYNHACEGWIALFHNTDWYVVKVFATQREHGVVLKNLASTDGVDLGDNIMAAKNLIRLNHSGLLNADDIKNNTFKGR